MNWFFNGFFGIAEKEETKRIQIREETKRIEIREVEETKRILGLAQIHEVETKKRKYPHESKSSFGDLEHYVRNFWEGKKSMITPFQTLFSISLPQSPQALQLPWIGRVFTAESEYQSEFFSYLEGFGVAFDQAGRLFYNSEAKLFYRDTHSIADHLIGDYKPDVTVYRSHPDTDYDPGPNPSQLCYFVELQLGSFDFKHAENNIKRSECLLKRAPSRSHVFSLWLTQTEIVVHKAIRQDSSSFSHLYSPSVALNSPTGHNILHFFLTHAGLNFFGEEILLSLEIIDHLRNNDLSVTDFLGSGTFSNVLQVTGVNPHRVFALKIYHSGEVCLSLHDKEVQIMISLNAIEAVPSVCASGSNWILMDKVCVPLNSSSLNRTIATQLWKSLDAVHEAGYLWCDCRPDNIGIYEGRPLLIDWNLAAAIGEVTNPHDGTRCYASQRLLRFPLLSPPILRTREDDLESLLKCLIEISYGKIHSLVHEQEEPCGRAAVWERHYSSFWRKDIRTALREFIECLQADMSNV